MIWLKYFGNYDEVVKIIIWFKVNGEYGFDYLVKLGYENYKL